MATRVCSYSKINLGLAIGPPRADGFHGLTTLYQTIGLHDVITISAKRAGHTRVLIQSNDSRVPTDGRNTVCKMITRALAELGWMAEVTVHIQKNLPIQGGMGAGSANAAAALVGLERELGVTLGHESRMRVAAEVGSDVPLFLIGGAVLGTDRGQQVAALPDLTLAGADSVHCVMAIPRVGVSTPQAFRDWDARLVAESEKANAEFSSADAEARVKACPSDEVAGDGSDLHKSPVRDTLKELSRVYASVFRVSKDEYANAVASGISPASSSAEQYQKSEAKDDLAENSLLALVHTGIENDFEQVVFLQYPSLCAIKRQLMGNDSGTQALYAALSGSGSALFGLYRSEADAIAAQRRVQTTDFGVGVQVFLTRTLSRKAYWRGMIAE